MRLRRIPRCSSGFSANLRTSASRRWRRTSWITGDLRLAAGRRRLRPFRGPVPAPGCPALVEGGRVKGLLAEGEERVSRGDFTLAMRIFSPCARDRPGGNSQALNDLGVVQWQSGDAVAAVTRSQVALGFNPGDSDALSKSRRCRRRDRQVRPPEAYLLERLAASRSIPRERRRASSAADCAGWAWPGAGRVGERRPRARERPTLKDGMAGCRNGGGPFRLRPGAGRRC
jgi:hypothetical protein